MADLTEFQLTTLATVAAKDEHGLGIKSRLEEYYNVDDVNHGRLYPALDEMAEAGLINKSEKDARTNWYEITSEGKDTLQARVDYLSTGLDTHRLANAEPAQVDQ